MSGPALTEGGMMIIILLLSSDFANGVSLISSDNKCCDRVYV